MIRRDMTNVLPEIRAKGLSMVQHMKYSGLYSRTWLRKAGLIKSKFRRASPGWKQHP